MKLAVPANFDDDFFDKINLSRVTDIFGKLTSDAVGGGRSSNIFFPVPRRKFKEHVRCTRQRGITFNYLLNATCLNNTEFTRKGHRRIRKLLDFISDADVNMVTVSLPQLAVLVKKHYPHLKISVSSFACVNNMERVRYWEELGVDQITLSFTDVNRNFKELKRILRYASCEIQTIANQICRKNCPFQGLHGNYHSHASQAHNTEGYAFDYYCITCFARFFTNPSAIMRSEWIRPEDLHYYEEIGLEKFKLIDRGLTSDSLAKIVQAYTDRKYDGNFMDLLPGMSKYKVTVNLKLSHGLRYFLKPHKVNSRKMLPVMRLIAKLKSNESYYRNLGIYMDNKQLDGFLEHFVNNSCSETFCDDCSYCRRWAEKAIVKEKITVDGVEAEAALERLTNGFATGEFF
jgi:collagenase-like PrtC family protease